MGSVLIKVGALISQIIEAGIAGLYMCMYTVQIGHRYVHINFDLLKLVFTPKVFVRVLSMTITVTRGGLLACCRSPHELHVAVC